MKVLENRPDPDSVRIRTVCGQSSLEPFLLPLRRACYFMERYHYLGLPRLVGESLRHVAKLDGQAVALLGWAATL